MTTQQDSTSRRQRSSTPNPGVEADLPGFTAPLPGFTAPPPVLPDPLPATARSSSPSPSPSPGPDHLLVDVGDGGAAATASPGPETTPAGSSQASIEAAAPFLAQLIGTALQLVGLALHRLWTPGDDQRVWLPTETEVADISGPLGRIAARHVPIGDAIEGDVGDAIEAGVAATGYAMRSVAEQHDYRAQRAAGAEGWNQQAQQDAG